MIGSSKVPRRFQPKPSRKHGACDVTSPGTWKKYPHRQNEPGSIDSQKLLQGVSRSNPRLTLVSCRRKPSMMLNAPPSDSPAINIGTCRGASRAVYLEYGSRCVRRDWRSDRLNVPHAPPNPRARVTTAAFASRWKTRLARVRAYAVEPTLRRSIYCTCRKMR